MRVEGQIAIDCSRTITERHWLGVGGDLCPAVEEVFRRYCDPTSAFSGSDGVCELVDYYGNRLRLRVCALPHEFEARPYPVGFVARHDPFGTFHPTTRVRWIPPALWSPSGAFPTYADSGWGLWTRGRLNP